MRYKLTISYDGTNYSGWQVQKNALSIQSVIQKALETFLRAPTFLTGSGRTDSGVHAKGQVAHFESPTSFEPKKLLFSLNGLLPRDIRIKKIEEVPPDFHARYSAKSKIYHYYLLLDPIADPFRLLYRHQVFGSFDKNLLIQGAQKFVGTHDFTSFANVKEDAGTDAIRTLYRLDVVEENGGLRLEFEGNGFLYKMVRNITGTLLDVARGKIEPEAISTILQARDRTKAGPAAPAHGLFLMQVNYS